jgi:NADPH-dependent 2,4-dienoyl-CoA reductase/sulfur reductase-like enzyme
VKKHVLILGAGFGGLELATRLSETFRDEVRVTLLDRNDSFVFGYSKLEVMLGRQSAADVRLHYREIDKDGVEFRQETVTGVDPVTRRVATDAGFYDADFLVVAMGADYDMDATPGLEGSTRAVRRVGRLLRRVRRRARQQGRGQLPQRAGSGGAAIRRVARVRRREGGVRRDQASALVRALGDLATGRKAPMSRCARNPRIVGFMRR